MAFRFPGDLQCEKQLWKALIEGQDLVGRIGPERWSTELLEHPKRSEAGRSITFAAGVLSRIDEFDAGFFGISPREAAFLDPQQRLLLELAWEAMEDGGVPPASLAGSDCAVYVGISGLDYGIRGLDDLSSMSAHSMTGNTLSIAANRLSYVFDLRGPSLAIDTACSSSLVALHHACNSLHAGEASVAMVGGVNLLLHPYPFIGFTKASMLSARGRCHTFDASGDGYVRAEGGAVLLLKPLEKAIADGDRIHAVIRGSGVNADGARKTGITIPSRDGQIELMRSVLQRAGLAADDIDYIEAHGTGTAVGDPIETAAIGAVYGSSRPAGTPLPIGSVKTNLGHLEPASGMAGLVKAVMVLKNRQLAPSIHLQNPNPKIDFAGLNLEAVTSARPLTPANASARPLHVGVNSFGFGGANAHVLLQEYQAEHAAQPLVASGAASEHPPLILSARTTAALREMAGTYASLLRQDSGAADYAHCYYDIAYAAAFRRERMDKRLALRIDGLARAAEELDQFAHGKTPPLAVLEDALPEPGTVAFIYSGNGSQWAGMGQRLLASSPRFHQLIAELDAPINAHAGYSILAELQADAATSRLDDTAVAQPLLFAMQVAITTMLRERGIEARAVTGHSVGEVAAAWASGALDLEQAIRVICARSAAQALTRGTGRMAAIALADKAVRELLQEHKFGEIEIAGINSPGNVTISGPLAELERLGQLLTARSVFFRLLDLDYAFHSRCMDPIEDTLVASLAALTPTTADRCDFISTVTGDTLDGTALDAAYWWHNVRKPVRFGDGVNALIARGCRVFIEIGPNAILQRYISECLTANTTQGRVLPTLRRDDDGPERLHEAILRAHLAADGTSLRPFFPAVGRQVELPHYPWQRERHWLPHTSEGYRLIERARVHPLLGWRLKDSDAAWENVLDIRTQPWLADHKVGGAVVLPGAAYVDMALAAAHEWFGTSSLELEELDIIAPVVFDGEHGRSLRLELHPRDGSFQIRSRERLSDDEWALNAAGRLLGAVTAAPTHAAAALSSQQAASAIDAGTHYRLAHLLGLDYGPAFQRLGHAELHDDTLEGSLVLPADAAVTDAAYFLPPASLDVCFQSLLGFFRTRIEAGQGLPLLPVKIGRLRYFAQAPISSFRTRLLRRSPRSVLADFDLFGRDGQLVATLSACRFRAASVRQHRQSEPATWEVVPRLLARPADTTTAPFPPATDLARKIRAWFVEHEATLKRTTYFAETQPLFDALVIAFAHEAFRKLFAHKPEWLRQCLTAPDDIAAACRPLFAWLKLRLQDEGLLIEANGAWRLDDSDLPPPDAIWRTLLRDYPATLPELVLIARIGEHLAELLAGDEDVGTLLRELENSHQGETLYDDSLAYVGTRHALQRALDLIATDWPTDRRLRILEIAPGVSELPRDLAGILPLGRVDYVLAHPDPAVCDQLRAEYRDHAFVTVAEIEPGNAGFAADAPAVPDRFDVVIQRHTLHRSGNPRGELAWTQRILCDGGLLVVAERQADLSAVFRSGIDCNRWHQAADGSYQTALLSPQAWVEALAEQGFDQIATCIEPGGEGLATGAYLVLASKAPAVANTVIDMPAANWLLLCHADAPSAELAATLAGQLAARGQHVATMPVCGTSAEHSLATASATQDMLRAARQQLPAIDHIVDLSALSLHRTQRDNDAFLEDTRCIETLNLVQGLEKAGITQPRLWLLTSGGVPTDGLSGPQSLAPVHAARWGLGRVVMNECPALRCTLIDVAAELPPREAALQLEREFLHPDGECEIALTAHGRYGLRMRRTALREAHADAVPPSRFHLDFHVPGQLRNLVWLPDAERALADDEVEVRPLATGLNFRDIMYVMGLLPDDAVENGFAGASLGLEFSGIVTRTGKQVTKLAPGDAVMGFGAACFASHVITKAITVTPKPDAWSFEAAATVPTVFLTVYYALKQLANLQPGERVLIHGAAGGVGIAAVQFARHLGAEVFATAGNPEKRDFVRLLGADHVFDSRSLAFADHILERTAGEGVDVVLNSLAGEAIRRNLHVLKPFGRFLELGKRDFVENTPIGLRPFKDNISYFGIDADQLLIGRPQLATRLFGEVMELFRTGVLSPLPCRAFPAERVVDAFRYMQQARQIGKVVVTFENAPVAIESPSTVQPEPHFRHDATYLVTGGLTGFGLESARWLAAHGAGSLVLLGRRGLDTPGAQDAVREIEALGAQVTVMPCNVADRAAVQAILERIGRELPPLRGVLHAAMVLDDGLLGNLDAQRMRDVLMPKAVGAWHLHELTLDVPLDHFILYSSVTTFIGNPGQGNYVAANAFLEGLAVLRRSLGLPVSCIGWGPIGDAGYLTRNQAVKESLASRLGAEPLTTRQALATLGRALSADNRTLAVADFDWPSLSRLLPASQAPRFAPLRAESAGDGDMGGDGEDFQALIAGKTASEVQDLVRNLVRQEVATILCIAPERIDPAQSLRDLGLDSLMGVELALGLEKRFGIQLPAMMLNEGPTIERVTTRIVERVMGGEAPGAPEGGEALTTLVTSMAVQHGEAVSAEDIAATITDLNTGR